MTGLRIERLLPPDFLARALREDARTGLTATPKSLPPKWFYDANGSALFEKITELPEYYPTRAERAILAASAGQIAAASGAHTLVELGSGSSDKTRLLLDALRAAGTLRSYVPVDVSETALADAGRRLLAEYPDLSVHAMVSDFEHHLGLPAGDDGQSPRMIAFLGSTIGNMLPAERAQFLTRIRGTAGGGDTLLLGTDLVKDPAVLVAAYDDPAGVTAAFNKNVLAVLNAELGADFDLDAFEHVALWDARAEWIEMRLRSSVAQRVRLPAIGLTVGFASRRGDADRGVGQVPARGRRGGARGRRVRAAVLVDRSAGTIRPVAVRARLAPRPPAGLPARGRPPVTSLPARRGPRRPGQAVPRHAPGQARSPPGPPASGTARAPGSPRPGGRRRCW